jgi:hypothetical protein
MQEKNNNEAHEVYKSIAINMLIPSLFIIMTGCITWLLKMEDRVYQLQREAVTESKLTDTEKRITQYIDVRLNDLDSKLQIIIKQLDNLGDENK